MDLIDKDKKDISCSEVLFVSELSNYRGEELHLRISQTIHLLRGWIEYRLLDRFRPRDIRGLTEYLISFMRGDEETYNLDYKMMTVPENFVLVELLVDLTNLNIKAYNYLNVEEMKDLVNWLKDSLNNYSVFTI